MMVANNLSMLPKNVRLRRPFSIKDNYPISLAARLTIICTYTGLIIFHLFLLHCRTFTRSYIQSNGTLVSVKLRTGL